MNHQQPTNEPNQNEIRQLIYYDQQMRQGGYIYHPTPEAVATQSLSQLSSRPVMYQPQNVNYYQMPPNFQVQQMQTVQGVPYSAQSPIRLEPLDVAPSHSSTVADVTQTPQKVRTERYIKVISKGIPQARKKQLYFSWFTENNGLPDSCVVIVPERHPNVIINFKGINGWMELETSACLPPDHPVEFEMKLQHSNTCRRNNLQNQPIALKFYVIDRDEDGSSRLLGDITLNVILMSAKCSTKTLISQLQPIEKKEGIMENVTRPMDKYLPT